MMRRGVKPDRAYRAEQQDIERDDEVPHRESGWRAGRRCRRSNRGGEVVTYVAEPEQTRRRYKFTYDLFPIGE
jgi:hypothetical protein